MTPRAAALAARAAELLAGGLTPPQVVALLTPQTKDEAVAQARRLPLLHERPDDRGAAVARLAARAGMTRFRLKIEPDGRVRDDKPPRWVLDNPRRAFPGRGCTVEYAEGEAQAHFSFLGPDGEGGRGAHPLSAGGYWSHFADRDAVVAAGGPEAYAEAYTAAGPDRDKVFRAAFEWVEPDPVPKARRQKPVVGEHTARVVPPAQSPAEPDAPPQGRLF